jgi:hypothetical protein
MTTLRIWLVLAAASAVLCLPTVAAADTTVKARLTELNDSGAKGTVTLTMTDDGGLKVVIHSTGLVPGPPEYGTIFMALTTRGGATPQDGLDVSRMPTADKQGRLDYERTFSAKAVPDGLIKNLASLHVVQHGIDVNDNDKYDLEALGESTFAANLGVPNVPEEATDPASCGVVQGASAAEPAHNGPEMGGADVPDRNGPLLAAGALLLLLSAGFGVSAAGVRHRRSDR